MMKSLKLMALDVGTKRIGIALANSFIKIAIPFTTVEINNDVDSAIKQIIDNFERRNRRSCGWAATKSEW